MAHRTGPWGHLALGLALALGCAARRDESARPGGSPANLADADYPGTLAPALTGPDFMARQRLLGRAQGREFHGEAVVQKQGEALTLIGLTPFGTKAFVARQQGGAVDDQVLAPEGKLPFPPRFMLLDVNRVLFLGLPGAPLADGTYAGELHGERVTEVWQGGALLERRFERLDARPAGTITIRYEGGMKDGALPKMVRLDNGWFGYAIAIETVQWQAL